MNPIILNGRFRIDRRVGAGGFGLVYIGTDLHTHNQVAIKLMPVTDQQNMLKREKEICEKLQRGTGFAQVLWFGEQGRYRVLVSELLGPSLQDLLVYCANRFSLKTVLLIADQAIRRIEYIHNKGYIYRDVKPDNFLLGTGREGSVIYAIDFGLTKEFATDHAQPLPYQMFAGTTDFASINNHNRLELSRRDDLESLGYVLIYFIRGQLPWENAEVEDNEDIIELVGQQKANMTLEALCEGLPSAFLKYMIYVRGLAFQERPNYRFLRLLFSSLFHQRRFTHDGVFHWTEWRFRQLRHEPLPMLR